VDRTGTERAVVPVDPDGRALREFRPDCEVSAVVRATGAKLRGPDDVREMQIFQPGNIARRGRAHGGDERCSS
jgi:acyl CoA:acetate/3-ketoacid CoA transferase beta subunit